MQGSVQAGRPVAAAWWRPAMDGLAGTVEGLVVAALAVDLALTFTSTLLRYVLQRDLPWVPDASSILIAVVAFLGGPAFFRRSRGMAYTALLDQAHGLARSTMEATGLWIVVAVSAVALGAYPGFLGIQATQMLPVLNISHVYTAVWLGIGLALLALYAMEKLAALPSTGVLLGLAGTGIVAGAMAALRYGYAHAGLDLEPFWAIAPVLVLAFLMGTPIPVILALGGTIYFIITGDAPLVAIPSGLQYGISSFILLAIPFFMIAGALMEISGMAKRLIDMVQDWVGHWTGGLLIAEVVATYVFSGVSGSKAADMATIGAVMKTPVRQRGYPAAEFAAVLCASAAMSETVPPSLAMLILGSVTSLSISALFVAGIIPAIVLAATLIVAVTVRSRRKGWTGGAPFSWSRALRGIPGSIPALGVPVIVIGGIVGGVASPTESGSLAVVYGLVAAWKSLRAVGARPFYAAMRDATLTAGMVLLMVAAANVLAQAIMIDGLGTAIGGALGAEHSRAGFLCFSLAILIVIGILLEGFPAILIAAPIFLPAATHIGIDPLQFGILLIMATGIGVMMPPAGIGFYIACTVADAPMNPTMRASVTYNFCLLVGLAIIAAVPELTLWLPNAFGLH
jgi:C4-dicarboxylate transporter DctM subunit